VSDWVKRKPKVRPRASGKAIDAESPPHWSWKFLPSTISGGLAALPAEISRNRSPGNIANLRSRIGARPQLSKDFAFFMQETGWSREDLLWDLFHDADIMHIDARIQHKNREGRPISRKTFETILTDLRKLAERIERVNATDLSPARMGIRCNGRGGRLRPNDEHYFLKAFRYLPAILAFYCQSLDTNIRTADDNWAANQNKSWRPIVALTREHSLYEKIRKKTGQYHTDRLYRLVGVAREIQGLPPIKHRAFEIWLNRLKKHVKLARK
jgi:hypothetical protein